MSRTNRPMRAHDKRCSQTAPPYYTEDTAWVVEHVHILVDRVFSAENPDELIGALGRLWASSLDDEVANASPTHYATLNHGDVAKALLESLGEGKELNRWKNEASDRQSMTE